MALGGALVGAAKAAVEEWCKAADGELLFTAFRHAAAVELLLRAAAPTLEALNTGAPRNVECGTAAVEWACAGAFAMTVPLALFVATPRTPWLIMTVLATSMGKDTAMLPTVASTDASTYTDESSGMPRDTTSHV